MRLIDVDRLRSEEHTLDVDGIKLHNQWYSIYELEAEPIVEAIPIEWIEQYHQATSVYGIKRMIEDWRKEK